MKSQSDQENSNIGSRGDRGYNGLPPTGQQGQVKSASPQQGDNASKNREKQQQQQQQQGGKQGSDTQKQSKSQERQKS